MMFIEIILISGCAGGTVFLWAVLAHFFQKHVEKGLLKKEMVHGMMSFGAGIMLAAVSFVLVPHGLEEMPVWYACISFFVGATVFLCIERFLVQRRWKLATLLAMMLDFIPESIALWAVFVMDKKLAIVLAIFIGLQNLPESFNSFRDVRKSGFSLYKSLLIFAGLSCFGVFWALIGYTFLRDTPLLTAYLMIFASGGILYLLMQDIIPESTMKNHYVISLWACLGFMVWMLGEKIIS